jgi:ppGpp synthetase/RelA/SpoT-type nucleotidyltranferase
VSAPRDRRLSAAITGWTSLDNRHHSPFSVSGTPACVCGGHVMPDSRLEEIKEFLSREGQNYHDFLDRVRAACAEAERQIGPGIIRTIYTRADKQGGLVFKTPEKIAKALAAERVRTPHASPRLVEDIIGLTVVVHYPDEIPYVATTIIENLDEVVVKKNEFKKQHGYYAHHMVFLSQNVSTIGLYCELQIKTMLHDA